MKGWIANTFPYIASAVVALNLVTPKGESRRRYGTLWHELRHMTGVWIISRHKNEPTVLLTDSCIDSEPRRITMHAGRVCVVCGFCDPTEPDDEPDDDRATPLEYWDFEAVPLTYEAHYHRKWTSDREWTISRTSTVPMWTTLSHLNRMNCRKRKI